MSIKTSRPTPAPTSTSPARSRSHPRPRPPPAPRRRHLPRHRRRGLAPATVHGLLSGRRRAPADTTTVVAVTSSAMPRDRVDAGGTRLRLRALHVMGHGSARIARAVGVHPTTIRDLVRGDATTISPQLRDAITAVYDAWWDKRAPARTPAERARGHRRPQTRHRRELVRRRRPGRRPARHPRLPALLGLETRHRHRHRPRHLPARTPAEKDRHMADDERLTWGFILEVLDVMERHGYRRSDNEHAGQAIGLIRDVARIYEGTLDAPRGGYVVVPSSRPVAPQPPGARRHRLGRRGQDPAGRAGRSRRIQAGPGRDVRRLRRPVLHHLPMAPAGRRRLRPAGRPDDPSRRGLRRPAARPRPRGASQRRSAGGRRPGGRTVTWHRTALTPCTTSQPRRVTA